MRVPEDSPHRGLDSNVANNPGALPVLILAYNRPSLTRKVITAALRMNPPSIYFAVDGPDSQDANDQLRVAATQDLAELLVEAPVASRTLFRESRLGCRLAVQEALDWFFGSEPRGIVLEDDCVPEPGFGTFCRRSLDTVIEGSQIIAVTGGVRGVRLRGSPNTQVANLLGSSWGWAAAAHDWHQSFRDMEQLSTNEVRHAVMTNLGPKLGRLRLREFDRARWQQQVGLVDSWAYPWALYRAFTGRWSISPLQSMITNIGADLLPSHKRRTPQISPFYGRATRIDESLVRINENIETHTLWHFKNPYWLALRARDISRVRNRFANFHTVRSGFK